jgi:death on curing protein
MDYLDADDLRLIYLRIQLESSSSFTVPDQDKLKSIVDIPKQTIRDEEIYPTIYSKAAALMEAIIRIHYFVDGNKRVALQATEEFLGKNNIIVIFPLHSIKFSLYLASTKDKEPEELRDSILAY